MSMNIADHEHDHDGGQARATNVLRLIRDRPLPHPADRVRELVLAEARRRQLEATPLIGHEDGGAPPRSARRDGVARHARLWITAIAAAILLVAGLRLAMIGDGAPPAAPRLTADAAWRSDRINQQLAATRNRVRMARSSPRALRQPGRTAERLARLRRLTRNLRRDLDVADTGTPRGRRPGLPAIPCVPQTLFGEA